MQILRKLNHQCFFRKEKQKYISSRWCLYMGRKKTDNRVCHTLLHTWIKEQKTERFDIY